MGRHLSNQVEPEVVEALRNAVVAAYPKLSHRYYELKRKWLGLDQMQVWDRNAPLPMEDTRIVNWADAEKTVMDAYTAFDPRMGELAQPFDVKDWKHGECDLIPGKTAPNMMVVERDYPNTYKKFTSVGPLLEKLGNGGKGIGWNTDDEVELLGKLNHRNVDEGVSEGRPLIESAIDACETVLTLAPETNGNVAVKEKAVVAMRAGR